MENKAIMLILGPESSIHPRSSPNHNLIHRCPSQKPLCTTINISEWRYAESCHQYKSKRLEVELGAQRRYFPGQHEVTDLKAHDWQALKSWYIQSDQ